MKKVCTKCGVEKNARDFHKRKDTKSGLRSHCKDCVNVRNLTKYYLCGKTAESHQKARRKWALKNYYGLTPEDYDQMLADQNGVCYICGHPPKFQRSKFGGSSLLHVDHCHETGKVRKLLCNTCNTALGAVQDKVDTLEKMITYLKEHK